MSKKSQFQKPSEFMRNRRPELFSDSKETQNNTLPKNLLEYELENITSKSKEKNFEYFCRKICEKEIAPNLIPQTGPTGGGDSKADTETYPVSDAIAQTWHTYEALQSANERWAFAFSAQKTWKAKLKKDIAGLIGTNRNYSRIYFITSQFVRDKDRAELEDELLRQYGTSIRILGREWLVDRVYTNGYLDIAISSLDIQGYSSTSNKVLGAKDYSRMKELEDLESSIKDTNRFLGVEWQLADECLRAAQIIRSLEKSKDEIINAFLRAKRIAEVHKLDYQLFKINYHLAWTHFFWFDDIKEVLKLYPDVEKYCEASNQIDDIEKLNNLFNLVHGQYQQGLITEDESGITPKKELLLKLLNEFSQKSDRPATSLYAKSILAILSLTTPLSKNNLIKINEEFIDILKTSEGLIDFPIGGTLNLLKEIGDILEKADNYEQLFNRTVEITQKIESDIAAGDLVFGRARKAFLDERYNEAIRLFGKSIIYFAKDDCINELVLSLHGIAESYKQQGLVWAARGSYIAAIERSLSIFWSQKRILPKLPWLIKNLILIEIQIGRPIHVMHWKELLGVIFTNSEMSNETKKEFEIELNMQDVFNAILLLKTPFSDFSSLRGLPDLYNYLDMPFSRTATLYALGHLDVIRSDKFLGEETTTDDKLDNEISLWRKQPASRQIADGPSFEDTEVVNLRSKLLSVNLNIFCESNASAIMLGEMILSVSESLWATAIEDGIYPHRSSFNIHIQKSALGTTDGLFSYKTEVRNGETTLVIEYVVLNLALHKTLEDRQNIKDKILEVVISIFSHIAYAGSLDKKMEKLFGKEAAISRALAFSDFYIAIGSIFGKEHSFTSERWIQKSDKIKNYEILRKNALSSVEVFPLDESEEKIESSDVPPENLVRPEKGKHGSHHIESLIDVNLWDKAKWRGTGFLFHPQIPPHLLFAFEDYENGKQIFIGVKNKIGNIDANGKIRLVIIKGIDKKNPFSYSVVFSSNLPAVGDRSNALFILSRINRMEPKNSTNLDNFESAYKAAKFCILAPCSMSNFMPDSKFAIQLKEVVFRNAWEIGENDMDIMGIPEDCDPIIPSGIESPPIFKSRRYKKNP